MQTVTQLIRRRSALYFVLFNSLFVFTCLACSKVTPGSTQGQGAVDPMASVAPHTPEPERRAVAVLAGGCFWGMEEILRKLPGVIDTEVGYTGGNTSRPDYEDVHTGTSGHAEAVRVIFDESRLSYRDLLEKWFFRMHDPTTKNRQGNDVGSQYRSAIFVSGPEQRRIAESVIQSLNKSGKFDDPIVTTIEPAGPFTPAEDYHQDYLQKNPGGYTCHYLRDWT